MSVYKYVTPERIDILEKRMIRFTQPAHFNDPFELKPFIHSLAEKKLLKNVMRSSVEDRAQFQEFILNALVMRLPEISLEELEKGIKVSIAQYYTSLNPKINEQELYYQVNMKYSELYLDGRIDMTKVSQLYADMIFELLDLDMNPNMRENLSVYLSNTANETFRIGRHAFVSGLENYFAKNVGVLSLSKTAPIGNEKEGKNLVMWAHYTDTHRGFVIEFDETHEFFDQRVNEHDTMRHLHSVQYTVKRPNMTLFETETGELNNDQLTDHFKDNFFYTKSIAWKYEQEMRMLLPLEDGQKQPKSEIYLFEFPLECLSGVYLGHQVSSKLRERMSELIKTDSRYDHINLYQTSTDKKEFLLNAQLI